ncbi:hypothetical protein I4U23_010685 [Adineta vaga]|nr:hypothetical protein I4U23_010685 [Adineta vaga]
MASTISCQTIRVNKNNLHELSYKSMINRKYSSTRVQKIRRSSSNKTKTNSESFSLDHSRNSSIPMKRKERLSRKNTCTTSFNSLPNNNQFTSSSSTQKLKNVSSSPKSCFLEFDSTKELTKTKEKKVSTRHKSQISFSPHLNINNRQKINRRCCYLAIAALFCGLLLGALIAASTMMALQLKKSATILTTMTSTTSTTATTTTTTSATTSTSTTSSTSSSSSTSTSTTSTSTTSTSTSTSTTTTTTTAFDSCKYLQWNQTGTVVAGSVLSGSTSNQLDNPYCLYIDINDILYICDYDNHRIQKWIPNATNGTTIAGNSSGNPGSTSSLLRLPFDLTFDTNGYLYVADSGNNRVQCFPPNSLNGTTVAGTGLLSSASNGLNHPTAVLVDNNFDLYVLDEGNTRLMRWSPNAINGTTLIDDINLNYVFDFLFVSGSSNQVYLSDNGASKIRLWTFNSSTENGFLQTVNSSTTIIINQRGLVYDPYGNLYVADTPNNRIVMFCGNSTVGIVVAKYSSGVPTVYGPTSVAFDSNLNLYVANMYSDNVVRFSRL